LVHLQELVYEGRREPYADLHVLEKAIGQKWNEIDDQTIMEKASSSSQKQDGRPSQYIFS